MTGPKTFAPCTVAATFSFGTRLRAGRAFNPHAKRGHLFCVDGGFIVDI